MSAPLPPIESVAAMWWDEDPESLRADSNGLTRACTDETAERRKRGVGSGQVYGDRLGGIYVMEVMEKERKMVRGGEDEEG